MKKIRILVNSGIHWHVIGIAVFIFIELKLFASSGMSAPWLSIAILYVFNIFFFYISAYTLIPMTKKIIHFRLIRIPFYFLYIMIYAFIIFLIAFTIFKIRHGVYRGMVTVNEYSILFYRSATFFILAKVLAMFIEKIKERDERLSHEKLLYETNQKNLEMENLLLRSQLNPHFLNNGLAFIQSESLQRNENFTEWITSFADVMKYHLATSNNGMVNLDDDLDHLQNYVTSMQELHQGKMNINFIRNIDEVSGSTSIYPLLFMPFVENMFKHGELKAKHNIALITINRVESWLTFHTENETALAPAKQSNGIGISNTKRRLQLLYPDRHELKTTIANHRFIIDLKIRLWNT